MLSRYDSVQKKTIHVSVNSVSQELSVRFVLFCENQKKYQINSLTTQCLRPLCSVDGWAVTTIEGIGGCVSSWCSFWISLWLSSYVFLTSFPQQEDWVQPGAAIAGAAQWHSVRLLQPRHGYEHLQVQFFCVLL